jgi:hypothetical protein
MTEPNGSRLWVKILGLLIPLLLTGAIAFGVLRSEADGLRRDVDQKASRDVVEAQYQSLLRELQNINQRLERIERRP